MNRCPLKIGLKMRPLMSLLVLSFALITTPDGSRRAVRVCRVTRVLLSAMNKGLWIKSIPHLLMLVRAQRFGAMIEGSNAQRVLADKAYASTANRDALKGKHRDGIWHKAVRGRLCVNHKNTLTS